MDKVTSVGPFHPESGGPGDQLHHLREGGPPHPHQSPTLLQRGCENNSFLHRKKYHHRESPHPPQHIVTSSPISILIPGPGRRGWTLGATDWRKAQAGSGWAKVCVCFESMVLLKRRKNRKKGGGGGRRKGEGMRRGGGDGAEKRGGLICYSDSRVNNCSLFLCLSCPLLHQESCLGFALGEPKWGRPRGETEGLGMRS